jgi:uncharacterized protein (TIGR03437 family)
MRKILAGLVIALGVAPVALPYYHFIRFSSRFGPFTPIYDRFDVSSLPDKTVLVMIADATSAGLTLAEGDSYPAVLSQVRAASRVWNGVDSSELRVQFGGVFTPGTVMNSPAIEILFDELPAGVVGMGGPVVRGESVSGPNGQFTPILKSQVILPRNLTARPSWGESFFLTAVHEIGHALGLQHTYTSGVMSTEITRATTKARPLGPDDVAGISILYPTPAFYQNSGSISGRVALGGNGVALASVVALTPNGGAVSALTNPDGSYRIDGLAQGFYYVYAHSLPPANSAEARPGNPVNVELPTDPSGAILPGANFDLQFYPGGNRPQQTVFVSPGAPVDSINFNVTRRNSVSLYGVQTYSFYTNVPVKPGFILIGSQRGTVVMAGAGLVANRAPASGLNLSIIGGPEQVADLHAYNPSPDYYLQLDLTLNPFSGEGVRHLVFSTPSETYVLPGAFALASRPAPSFTAAVNPDRTVTLTGMTLSAATRVLFDGVPARQLSAQDGQITVTPPRAAGGHRAFITALNPDGQSSYFVLGGASPTFTYDSADPSQITVSPAMLPAGVETVVEINGTGTGFSEDALNRVGFGTSDVQVRGVWAVAPNKMLAQVMVSPATPAGMETATAVSGLELITQPFALTVTGPNPRQMYVAVSSVPGLYAYTGAVITLPVVNLPAGLTPGAVSVTVNDKPAPVLAVNGNQVTMQLPASLPPGAGVVRITANGDAVLPAAIAISAPPPVILGAYTSASTPVDAARPAKPGDTFNLLASGLSDTGDAVDPARVKVTTGSIEHTVLFISSNPAQLGTHLVLVNLNPAVTPANGSIPLTLSLDGRVSQTFALAARLP